MFTWSNSTVCTEINLCCPGSIAIHDEFIDPKNDEHFVVATCMNCGGNWAGQVKPFKHKAA